jgi:hypothetical protein
VRACTAGSVKGRSSREDYACSENAGTTVPCARLPGSIWAFGFVRLFMDISSEMVHALLPVFLVTVLGASTVTVGIIEGVGESLGFSGRGYPGYGWFLEWCVTLTVLPIGGSVGI